MSNLMNVFASSLLTSVVTCLKFSEIKSNWEDPETLKAFFLDI